MRKTLVVLFAAAAILGAAPLFATTCQSVNGPGPFQVHFECITASPYPVSNFTFTSAGSDSMACMYPSPDFYKSLGSYGSGSGYWSFTSKGDNFAYMDISVTIDLQNTHSHSGNSVSVLVYDDDAFTVETLATITGAGGDICSQTYHFTPYRPGWTTTNSDGKHLRLAVLPYFQDSDTYSRVADVSFLQFNQ